MKSRKIPMRRCVVTKEQLPKKELIRGVRTPEKTVIVDLNGKQNGRGAYIKRDEKVINKAQKNKILEKQLEVEIPDSIFEELKEIIK